MTRYIKRLQTNDTSFKKKTDIIILTNFKTKTLKENTKLLSHRVVISQSCQARLRVAFDGKFR